MKYLKRFNESIDLLQEHSVGDMVYVDTYGPRTLRFSDGGYTRERDLPFRVGDMSKFDNNTKYEIVYIDGDILQRHK